MRIPLKGERKALGFQCLYLLYSYTRSSVRSALHLTDDIIPLAEECKPLIQHLLLLIIEIVPFRHAVFRLERGAREGTRGVLARKD